MSSLNVLLVEDNRVSQKIGARLLSSLGYSADVAANGREALECCDRTPYGLILMDCQMPEMDGYEATRALRQRDSDTRPIVIALTAHDGEEERQQCFDAGMDDCLTKPVTRDRLAATIERWLPKIPTQP
ncbi:MAG: response regulator [Cyanobacteria bacterium J06639_1]